MKSFWRTNVCIGLRPGHEGLLVVLEVGDPRPNVTGLEVVKSAVVFGVEVVKLEVTGLELVKSDVAGSEVHLAALETVWSGTIVRYVCNFFSA